MEKDNHKCLNRVSTSDQLVGREESIVKHSSDLFEELFKEEPEKNATLNPFSQFSRPKLKRNCFLNYRVLRDKTRDPNNQQLKEVLRSLVLSQKVSEEEVKLLNYY